MKQISRASLLGLFLLSLLLPAFSQAKTDLSTVIIQLLDTAAPPTALKEVADAIAAKDEWPNEHNRSEGPEPGEDAPPKVFIDYWASRSGKKPSEKSRWRLLEACLEEPRFYLNLLDLLPDTAKAHDRVKQFLDQADNGRDAYYAEGGQHYLRIWLRRHSRYFREELIREAKKVDDENTYLKNEEDIEALANLDWQAASPIIETHLNSNSPHIAAYALGLIYEHTVESGETAQVDQLRERLKSIVTNKQLSGSDRKAAFNLIMQHDWQGRDDWFVSLLAQASSLADKDDDDVFDIFTEPVKRDPDKWIPILSKLVWHSNPSIHNGAVFCLAQFTDEEARKDALEPLLSWLTNPQWALDGDEATRSKVIESCGYAQMPECLQGLLQIVKTEKEDTLSSAASALAMYRDPRAIPVLRKAIEKALNDHSIRDLINALIACGGLSDEEKIASLEAIASESKIDVYHFRNESYVSVRGFKTVQGAIGEHLIEKKLVTESVAAGLIERWKIMQKENPQAAENLWLVAKLWNFPAVDAAIASRIAMGTTDLDTLLAALGRRKDLQINAGAILQPLLSQGGYRAGISAVMLSDEVAKRSILESKDTEALVALLACARIVREDLTINRAGELLAHEEKLLQFAAERYLESVDTDEARKLIQARHAGEALILGARSEFNSKSTELAEWDKWENALREDIKQGRADEIFGRLEFQYSDSSPFITRYSFEARMKNDEAEICKRKDTAREECRKLSPDELQTLRAVFDKSSFDDLPSVIAPMFGIAGDEQEFVRIAKDGGKRVYAANLGDLLYLGTWSLKNRIPHQQLESVINDLKSTGDFELRYALKEKIKTLEVLSADDEHPVERVCGEGSQLLVLLKDKNLRPRNAMEEGLGWHALSQGKIGPVAEQPQACQILDNQEDMPEAMRSRWGVKNPLWNIKAGQDFVRFGKWKEQEGLWLCRSGREPKLIAQGSYAYPTVSPDGRWLVAIKVVGDQANIIKIDLRTNKETKLKAGSSYYPIAVVPGSG
ncbi:MAG TPA: HEAT repeat domain-containing protein [Blastocatellia bacterium]|nr:HEAT repeat domain-containing protein [Blastocatellia bacterium]